VIPEDDTDHVIVVHDDTDHVDKMISHDPALSAESWLSRDGDLIRE
jgi:hypothetical protein